ncbi:MAG: heme ABC exporter ATP-binding protein CcmA [Deltaproteobacteria bacterium]|nr:heme ABC exporter ATP-binding protein CcmA [Deltaproteobacteria bacterium]
MSWVIEAENLTKTFAWVPVLNQVSCQIAAGEVVGVFGPNGAGKTTFLRVLATLLRPSTGKLTLFGASPQEAHVRRRLGFLGHESFLYPDLTPIENLTFYGRAYTVPDMQTRIATVLRQVGLQQWGNTVVRTFSRGMEQRLALARVLLHEPDLLLLDEPYTGLDAQGVAILQSALAHMKAQGKTIILTTHDFAFGLELCTRALIVDRGRIAWESDGHVPSVQEFIARYHSTILHSAFRIPHS